MGFLQAVNFLSDQLSRWGEEYTAAIRGERGAMPSINKEKLSWFDIIKFEGPQATQVQQIPLL